MEVMNFQYKECGDSIIIKMKDWRRVTKFLTSHGVMVTENFSKSTLRKMAAQKSAPSPATIKVSRKVVK